LIDAFFATLGVMVVRKTLGGEQHIAIKAYKFATFEILRFFGIIAYCMLMLSLHIESTDSIIYLDSSSTQF